MEYYYGFGGGRYNEALDEFRIHGGVHSCRTSSIPLAEFWQPDNLEKIDAVLRPYLANIKYAKAQKYFEFPTEAVLDGRPIGKPSMTDLMLLNGQYQIAIEAKYTEYSKMHHETVAEWLAKAESPRSMREHVAKCWFKYIHAAGCTRFDAETSLDEIGDVCYQFLHRAASACFRTDAKNGPKAVLIYQLFYDADNAKSIRDCRAYQAKLRRWAEMLKLANMQFLIMPVPIVNAKEIESHYKRAKSDLFELMKHQSVYKIDFGTIDIDNVLLQTGLDGVVCLRQLTQRSQRSQSGTKEAK